jgi:orotate phosphoribosyltransferase
MTAAHAADYYREQLRPLVKEVLILEPTMLASGVMSDFYFDGRLVTLSAQGAHCLAHWLLAHIPCDEYDAIGGLTMGADPIVAAVAAMSWETGAPKAGFIVRKAAKDHGRGKRIEGPIEPGARVVIVDDVATSGGSILDAARAAEQELGCKVVRVVALVDREEGARELFEREGYSFDAVFTASELRND